ncbi:MAG: hypothetical protein ABIG44_17665 [Planctomycetota bacterium]
MFVTLRLVRLAFRMVEFFEEFARSTQVGLPFEREARQLAGVTHFPQLDQDLCE